MRDDEGLQVAAMHACVGAGAPLAAQVAGGTHHAFADHGEGFCVFNDIAVAASTALRTYGEHVVAPILVIDLDVRPPRAPERTTPARAPFARAARNGYGYEAVCTAGGTATLI
jgi:hypothetical protein